MASIKDLNLAFDILSKYHGKNYLILSLLKKEHLNDFEIEYIIKNHDKEIVDINKKVKLSEWYSEKLMKELDIDFYPKRIKILKLIGETSRYYHCLIQYRKSVEPIFLVLPKNGVLTNFLVGDYKNLQLDFSWFDKKLKLINPDFSVMEHQKEATKFLLSRKKCILSLDMGLGKMEPISSIIPTSNGFKKMGDIVPGDKIYGSDGKEHNVLQIFPHKNKEIYRVNFSDGTSAECGLEHLWIVRDYYNRKKGRWLTLSLKELLNRGLTYNDQNRKEKNLKCRNKYEIPVCEPVEYSKKDYLIDPYVLGVCIGDGNLCNGRIAISIPDSEVETSIRIKNKIHEYMYIRKDTHTNCPRYHICYNKRGVKNPYLKEIERLNLNVHGKTKFIPLEYKLGSIEQRIELLRGLMDSDGSITKEKNKIVYSTNSKQLSEDVAELVNSLGGIARVHSYKRLKNEKEVIEYSVCIQIKINPFYLKRKHDLYKPTYKKYCHRYITSAEYVRNEDAQCIMVDSENHSYLTGKSYIVTHNTLSSIVASLMYGNKKVLVVCPASIKTNWKNELMRFVDEDKINIIKGFNEMNKQELMDFLKIEDKNKYKVEELRKIAKDGGNKWNEGKQFTILNFDIIDEFHTFSRNKTNNSDLLKSDFDVVIIDEAHKLSNNTSTRFKTIKNYLQKANNEYTWLLTGTMLTNDVKNLYNLLSLIETDITGDYNFYMEQYCGAKKILKKGEWDRCWNMWNKGRYESYYKMNEENKKVFKEFVDKVGKHVMVANESNNLEELKERIVHLYYRKTKEDIIPIDKIIVPLVYHLSKEQKEEYDSLWEKYEAEKLKEGKDLTEIKQLVSVAVNRQYISKIMVPNTIKITKKLVENNKKVFIICCYDEELYTLKEHFGEQAVIFNGKMNQKQKDNAVEAFNNDDNIKILIGNIAAVGVGINLNKSCNHAIFQNLDFTDAAFSQACDRIYRIGSKENAYIYLQYFKDTVYEHIVDIITRKKKISEQLIKNS